jgi:uncharacterized heparinase superfamily protein
MGVVSNYWHTLRYLRPVQLYGRIWFRLARPRIKPRPAPALRLPATREWIRTARRPPTLAGPERFCFLNETHELSGEGWDNPSRDKLWRYNLHYFDDLTARDAASRAEWHRALIARWVRENRPGSGTGWEPYPTSLRIVNWIKWALSGNVLSPESTASLALQARWLAKRLETHLAGNHLFTNAKALVFAGLYFDGAEATSWFGMGMRLLHHEVPEQILPDGGQFERSPMYHALALEDMLDLCNVTAQFSGPATRRWQPAIDDWHARIGHMRHWLAAMSHPDGEISYFNDASIGIAPPPDELDRYAERSGFSHEGNVAEPLIWLRESGYVRLEYGAAVAILDVAPLGPDYLPGHGHADTLSFELSLFGQRVLVNTGTSRYGDGPERLGERGTAAHNTVVVDGENSSEVWGGFRVARRARPVGLKVSRDGGVEVQCAHDGFRRLPGKPEHWRRWTTEPNVLVVEDRISGKFERAEAKFHVHPSVQLDSGDGESGLGRSVVLQLPQGQRARISVEGGAFRVEASVWVPEFGRTQPNLCLVAAFESSTLRTRVEWGDTV